MINELKKTLEQRDRSMRLFWRFLISILIIMTCSYTTLAEFKARGQLGGAFSFLQSSQWAIVPIPSSGLYFGFNKSTLTVESKRQLKDSLAAISGNDLHPYTFEFLGYT
jgi:outer membrane protein OmpA-like peptidoglycan-associated protein